MNYLDISIELGDVSEEPRDENGRWTNGSTSKSGLETTSILKVIPRDKIDLNATHGRWTGEESFSSASWKSRLLPNEKSALSDWFDENSGDIQRGDTDENMPEKTKSFISAVSKSPSFTGKAYRGMIVSTENIKNMQPGVHINMDKVSSWSTKKNIAKDFAVSVESSESSNIVGKQVPVVFTCKLYGARDISGYNTLASNVLDEREVIVRKTAFSVKDISFKNDIYYIDLSQSN
jgi:hypothetical protein